MENKILIKTESIERIDVIYNEGGLKPHVHIYTKNDSFIISFNNENEITLFLNTISSNKPPIFLEVTTKHLLQ